MLVQNFVHKRGAQVHTVMNHQYNQIQRWESVPKYSSRVNLKTFFNASNRKRDVSRTSSPRSARVSQSPDYPKKGANSLRGFSWPDGVRMQTPSFPKSSSNELPSNVNVTNNSQPMSEPKAYPVRVSVVIPVFNELKSVPLVVEAVASVMSRQKSESGGSSNMSYEIICVDDGSTDGSSQLLQAMAAERVDLTAVILRRNFGQTAALAAGFEVAAGELIVTMDADMQNNPEDIPRMIEVLEEEGVDLVCGWRKDRQDGGWRTWPSKMANGLIKKVTNVPIHDTGCTLKVWRAELAHMLRPTGETHRFLPALAHMEGATISEVEVSHSKRQHGSSKYSALGRAPRVILDLITLACLARFRDRPMHLFGGIGLICLAVSAAATMTAAFTAVQWLPWLGFAGAVKQVTGALVLALEMTVAALQFFGLGLIAEFATRSYFESRDAPVYRVRNIVCSNRTSRIKERIGRETA